MNRWQSEQEQPWDGFLAPLVFQNGQLLAPEAFAGKRILITGAGGFIGSALARALQTYALDRLVLLDIAEHGLSRFDQDPPDPQRKVNPALVVGSVCDERLVAAVFAAHRPHLVFHAAALKHVPLMEINPLAAVETNALGMHTMAKAAIAFGAERLVLLSTDKAVDPISIMGASKRLAELIVLANASATSMVAVRLCNVLGSTGSVAPHFLEQIARRVAVTVTHPDVTRYLLSIDDTVQLLLLAASAADDARLVIPRLGPPTRIADLARYLIDSTSKGEGGAELVYTQLRRADKLHESMTSSLEFVRTCDQQSLLLTVESLAWSLCPLDETLRRVSESLQQRDRAGLLEVICDAVPEYSPDDELQQNLQRTRTNAP